MTQAESIRDRQGRKRGVACVPPFFFFSSSPEAWIRLHTCIKSDHPSLSPYETKNQKRNDVFWSWLLEFILVVYAYRFPSVPLPLSFPLVFRPRSKPCRWWHAALSANCPSPPLFLRLACLAMLAFSRGPYLMRKGIGDKTPPFPFFAATRRATPPLPSSSPPRRSNLPSPFSFFFSFFSPPSRTIRLDSSPPPATA